MFKLIQTITGKIFNTRLKTQLVVSFMAMFLIVLVIGSLFLYTGIVNILKNQTKNEKYRQFQQLEYNIDTFINEVDKISRNLIISQDIQDYTNGNNATDFERIALVNRVLANFSREINNYGYIESIFYYGENGNIAGVTEKRNVCLTDISKKNFFYSSKLYEMVKNNDLKLCCYGVYSSQDFETNDKANTKSIYYISAARKVNYLGKQAGTIVININEKYFTSIYNNAKIKQPDAMYIMDNNGRIISDADISKLNSQSGIFEELNQGDYYGSFVSNQGGSAKQVVYFSLDRYNWIMVDEIPLNQMVKGILELRKILFVVFIISVVIAFLISMYWIYIITRPLNILTKAMKEMESGKLGHLLPETSQNELGVLGRQFNKMSKSISTLINNIKKIEDEKRKIEVKALQAQINPHFIYNTLNTIKYMAVIHKAKNVADSLSVLGSLLYPIFRNSGPLCTIKEEVDYSSNYFRIMNIRYGEGLQIDIDIPDDLMNCEILRFILQPIIENFFEHGIDVQNYIGTVLISARINNGEIHLIVEDNGCGMDSDKLIHVREKLENSRDMNGLEGEGIGLANVNRRIRLHYGENFGIDIYSSDGVGTKVVLRLPFNPI